MDDMAELDLGPEEGDYILYDTGSLGSMTGVSLDGKCLGVFETEEKAYSFVDRHMKGNDYFPSVWKQDDHGGFTLWC